MNWTQEDASKKLQSILINHFNIDPDQFDWELPLESLQEDFKILSYLIFLEQLIRKEFNLNIPIIENITTSFHTPMDILTLINNYL